MPRVCTICTHEAKERINRALIGRMPMRDIAAQNRVATSSLLRHRDNHLAPKIASAMARFEEIDADRLIAWLNGVNEMSLFALLKAKENEDWLTMRAFTAEARKNIEMLARLQGILDPSTHVTIDARKQLAILADLSTDELRALAAAAERNGVEALPAGQTLARQLAKAHG